MRNFRFLAMVAAASMLAACGGAGANPPGGASAVTQSSVVRADAGRIAIPGVHVMRMRGAAQPPIHFAGTCCLTYGGGPVQTSVKLAVVYWGNWWAKQDPNGERTRLNTFLRKVGGSSWFGTTTQYYQIVGGVTTYISNPSGNFLGVWIDRTTPLPVNATDAQIQAEANLAAAHFNASGVQVHVIVATPHNYPPQGFPSGGWCAYHGWTGTVAYTNFPYLPDVGYSCGANSVNSGPAGTLDGVTIVGGHEIAEAQTDPQPVSGWNSATAGEIGDECAWINLQNTTFGKFSFPTQPLYSNAVQDCVQ